MTVMSEKLRETLGIASILDQATSLDIPPPMDMVEYADEEAASLPVVFEKKEVSTSIPDTANSDLKQDYTEARNVTYTLLEMTGRALTGALEVAVESQHPKAYDSFNALANTMRGISKDLLEFQKIYKEVENTSKPKVANVTQNNITIGSDSEVEVGETVKIATSVTDILRNMKSMKNKPIEGEIIDGDTA